MPSPRKEILNHFDQAEPYAALLSENYKIVSGTTYNGQYDKWLSKPNKPDEENDLFASKYGESVMESDAGRALHPFSKSKSKLNANGLITANEINDIRRKAKVSCNGLRPAANDSIFACDPIVATCLFDLDNDPCETNNIAELFPSIVSRLESRLQQFNDTALPIRNTAGDSRSNPKNFDDTWTWWYDELDIESSGETMRLDSMLPFSLCVALAFVKYVI